jgi:hypothetical protein
LIRRIRLGFGLKEESDIFELHCGHFSPVIENYAMDDHLMFPVLKSDSEKSGLSEVMADYKTF